MGYFCRIFGLLVGKVLGILMNLFFTGLQGFFYLVFKLAAIENPDILKSKLSPDRVKYFLFTRDNPNDYVEIDSMHLDQLNNPNVKIVFIIHGWMSSRSVEWYEQLKNAFLQREEQYYVVQVDWSIPADSFYALASWSTKNVGDLVGKIIVTLNKDYSIPLSNFLVVGHSLGAQIAGFVGKKVLRHTQQKLSRIVALDPAGPLFNTRPEFERLNKHDAEVVQVIHTDGDTFGFRNDLEALDFFPNGGNFQPRRIKVFLFSLMGQITHSHEMSPRYFANAIANPEAYMATKCTSWVDYLRGHCRHAVKVSMGDLETTAQGKFYLGIGEE